MSAEGSRTRSAAQIEASNQAFLKGYALHQEGRVLEALPVYEALLARDPQHANALHFSALILDEIGRSREALERIERSLEIDPRTPDVWSNAALLFMAAGRDDDARRALEAALARDPKLSAVWLNLASLRMKVGDAMGAEIASRQAIACGDITQGLFNLALALAAQDRPAEALEALAHLQSTGEVADDDAAVPGMRAQILVVTGRRDEAYAVLDAALTRTEHPLLRIERARLRELRGDHAGAIADYQAALVRSADNESGEIALSELVFLKKRIADWDGLASLQTRFRTEVGLRATATSALTPFSFLSDPSTRREQRIAGASWSRRYPSGSIDARPRTLSEGRLRIGYLSSDFHDHATGVLTAGLFEHHDRDAFEVIGYSTGRDDGSALRRRLVAGFDRFIDAFAWSPTRLAETIANDRIDILVDLKGHTEQAPTAVVAARPAPIQVSYLGYPASIGAPFIDYLIGDPIVTPDAHRADYSETVVQLPICYQVNDERRVDAIVASRADVGLPDGAFVYCSFNNIYKIAPDVFDAWMEILRAVPDSVLWLLTRADEAGTRLRLHDVAAARYIAPERIVFADHRAHADYLGLYAHADVFLDTWPYNAHTTASDALWMGCPVLTLHGETFAGRVAESLLAACGLQSWVATDRKRYLAMAIVAARRARELRAGRDAMRQSTRASALFDTVATTRAIEAAYRTMAAQYRAGHREPFRVDAA